MKRKLFKSAIVLFIVLFLFELSLRLFLDNERRILYIEDADCEYRFAPNQNEHRFHNHISTNSYGMRSVEVKKNQRKRILIFGDSVLNGGTKVDQADLLNYKLENALTDYYHDTIAVFNISAGSWGPENAYQFMVHNVDFKFDMIILLFSSHDLHDNMHHRKVVGVEAAWPDKQPIFAISDFCGAYLMPKFYSWFGNKYDYLEGFNDSAVNPGWSYFEAYAEQNNLPLWVYVHPDVDELSAKKYSSNGYQLIELLDSLGIKYFEGLTVESGGDYLDNIHINAEGHEKIYNKLFNEIINTKVLGDNIYE